MIFFDAIGKIRTSKVFFCCSSDELKIQFRCSDVVVVINLKQHFDVVMVSKFFDVLFGFRRCDFRSSDLFPFPVYACVMTIFVKLRVNKS